MQSLDLAAMDLQAFHASLVPTMPDLGSRQREGAAWLPACCDGEGRR